MDPKRYVTDTVAIMNSCPRWRDKALVAVNRVLFVPIFLMRKIARKEFIKNYPLVLWDIVVETEGVTFICRKHTVDFECVTPAYESQLCDYMLMTDAGIFIDIGAHIGKYTVPIAKKLGNKGKVVAIEPDPDNFRALLQNIAVNNLYNVIPIQVACSSDNGETLLYKHPLDPSGNSMVHKSRRSIVVQTKTLDTIVKDLGLTDVRLIKIDVEGAELDVLKGASNTLSKFDDLTIVIESRHKEIIPFLQNFGFSVECVIASPPPYYVARKGKVHVHVNSWSSH